MRPQDHEPEVLATGDVVTRLLRDGEDAAAAVALLDRAEEVAGIPLVDESERHRLANAVSDGRAEHHHAVMAHVDGRCVGYAGLVVPPSDAHGAADVAVAPDAGDPQPVLRALLHAIDHVAMSHDAHGTEVWKRQASADDIMSAVASGYAVHRRLCVLGRPLHDVPTRSGRTRAMRPGDEDAVVAVLAAAYEGTAEAGWTRERLEERTAYDWFDPDDLLVAEVDGRILGVHWTKRRGPRTGEVYNLAVHPDAQGRRLGKLLLADGLAHLARVGCDDVLLWVDLNNEAAVRLYVGEGFRARWEDVALRRHTREVPRHQHAPPPRRG